MYVTRGDGTPARQPLGITVLDALARGIASASRTLTRPGLGLLGSDWFTKLRLALLVVPVLMLLFGGLVTMLVALGA
jgi:hypothetical protein